jgi:hypothetical protein
MSNKLAEMLAAQAATHKAPDSVDAPTEEVVEEVIESRPAGFYTYRPRVFMIGREKITPDENGTYNPRSPAELAEFEHWVRIHEMYEVK